MRALLQGGFKEVGLLQVSAAEFDFLLDLLQYWQPLRLRSVARYIMNCGKAPAEIKDKWAIYRTL